MVVSGVSSSGYGFLTTGMYISLPRDFPVEDDDDELCVSRFLGLPNLDICYTSSTWIAISQVDFT